jgi:hypothetical protein
MYKTKIFPGAKKIGEKIKRERERKKEKNHKKNQEDRPASHEMDTRSS